MEMKAETNWIELWQGSEGFRNVPHTHEGWMQITLPLKGTCHFTQDEHNYDLQRGSGLIQPSGAMHHFHIGKDASVIIMKVRERGLGGMDSIQRQFQAGDGHDIRQTFDADEVVGRFRHWMVALIQGQALADPIAVQDVENDVVTYLGRLIGTGSERAERSASLVTAHDGCQPQRGITDPHLQRAIQYMHDCYVNPINVDELAGLALQSRYHFIRSFREATGITPYQYLLKLRMEEAKSRLRRTEAAIGQISVDLGFSSTSQFHRTFLKLTGLTPQAYRLQ